MLSDKDILSKALDLLKKMKLQNNECSIYVETGFDESIFVGTKDSYIKFAIFLLEIANANINIENKDKDIDYEIDKIGNIDCYSSGDLKKYFDEYADVFPVSLYVVNNDDDKQKLYKHLKT